MLSIYQSEKVAVALKLIKEVEQEVVDTDIHKSILLGDAAEACDEVLTEDLPEGYSYTPLPVKKLKRVPSASDRILGVLGWIAGTSLLSSALCACIALGSWGISEYKSASGIRDNTDYAAQTRGYRGLTFTFLSITLTCGVLGAVIGDAVSRSND